MLANSAIEKHPVTVHPNDTVLTALQRLHELKLVRAAVVDDNGTLVGLLGYHDILEDLLPSYVKLDPNLAHALSESHYAKEFTREAGKLVSTRMVKDFSSVASTSPLGEAIALMHDQHWQPLPVVDGGKFVGLITRSSMLIAIAQCAADAGALSTTLASST